MSRIFKIIFLLTLTTAVRGGEYNPVLSIGEAALE